MNVTIDLAKKHLLDMPENNDVLKADLIKIIKIAEDLKQQLENFNLHTTSRSLPLFNSTELIELANERRNLVERKNFEWRSYYNGFLDGFATYYNEHNSNER